LIFLKNAKEAGWLWKTLCSPVKVIRFSCFEEASMAYSHHKTLVHCSSSVVPTVPPPCAGFRSLGYNTSGMTFSSSVGTVHFSA
jgi:hypothetical protein